MHPARIAELLAPFLETPPANDTLYDNISTYIDILLRWNARINLTAVRGPEQIVTRHFGESVFAARHLFPATVHVGTAAPGCPAERSSAAGGATKPAVEARKIASSSIEGDPESQHSPTSTRYERSEGGNDKLSVADVGSGAGFPGIPFKLWNPHINLTLIESNHKKAAFLREVARSLTLTDINVFNGRAEDLAQLCFDLVTLRAVEHFEDALRISAALLVPGGRLALLIGSSQQDATTKILPSFLWAHPQPVPLSRSRVLLVGTSPEA